MLNSVGYNVIGCKSQNNKLLGFI